MTDEPRRVRAAVVRIFDHGESTTVMGASAARRFDGDSANLLRAVLEIHGRPVTRRELLAELEQRAGGTIPADVVDELVELLVEDHVLVPARAAAGRPPFAGRRVVLGISGAVAAVDTPALVRGLHGLGCEVRVALSESAQRFVAVAALEALTHHQVWTGLWQRDERAPVPHINLAEWAELVLIYPATATTLARIATGDCSELVPAIAAATRAQVVVVPSMNDAMYASPAVQANLETLRAHGRWVVHPALGIEVAHAPDDRRPMFGPAPPAGAVLDLVRHLLGQLAGRPQLPADRAGWERLWATTPAAQLPWHADHLEPPLAHALDERRGDAPRRLVDLGTGDGTVAIEAARRGYRVTATDVSPSALGRARERAGDLPIIFVLDDVLAARLDGSFDVAVDRGLLHCLPHARRGDYAAAVTRLVVPGGSLLVVAHEPGAGAATAPVDADELRALLPAFELVRTAPLALARTAAQLYELERR